MFASVFFDLRPLHDPEGLFGELHEHVLEHSRANRIFIAYMASNALKHRPPLGFFRNFVLISGGDHDHTLDIKHRGTVPVVDLARVNALSAGIPQINTIERLEVGAEVQGVEAAEDEDGDEGRRRGDLGSRSQVGGGTGDTGAKEGHGDGEAIQ